MSTSTKIGSIVNICGIPVRVTQVDGGYFHGECLRIGGRPPIKTTFFSSEITPDHPWRVKQGWTSKELKKIGI